VHADDKRTAFLDLANNADHNRSDGCKRFVMRADEKLTAFLELESAIRDCSIGSKLSLQRGGKFREGMGDGLRFRITRNDGHKPKTKKENHIMKNRKNILTYIVAALSILVTSASSSLAAPGQTYHGTLTGSTFYCNGEESDFSPTVTGTWNLIIDPQTAAQLTLDVFVNRRHDVAFGNNELMLISQDDGVYVFSAFGGFATATLDTSVTPARFSWHVEFGVSCPDQNPFNSLTFFGVANRGGG
jgi:hypothetical protein